MIVYRHYENHDYYSRGVYVNLILLLNVLLLIPLSGTIPNSQSEGTEIYEALITP